MKSLKDSILDSLNEGAWTSHARHKITDIDKDKFEEACEKLSKDGLGAAVAMIKFNLVTLICSKALGLNNPNTLFINPASYNKDKPMYGEYEEILDKYFNTYYDERGDCYLAPKSTPKSRIKRWLDDDFRGTQETSY